MKFLCMVLVMSVLNINWLLMKSIKYKNVWQCSVNTQNPNNDQVYPLQLTVAVMNQRYCRNPNNDLEFIIQLELELTYKNIGQQTLLIYKNSNKIGGYNISRTKEDALLGNYELKVQYDNILGWDDYTAFTISSFIELHPGKSYKTSSKLSLVAFRIESFGEGDLQIFGEHVLQISIRTYRDIENNALQEELRKKGKYWDKNMISQPMLFTIEKTAALEKCF